MARGIEEHASDHSHVAYWQILLQKWPTMPAVVAILDVVPALCNRSLRGERR
jgi:hypothetical protein